MATEADKSFADAVIRLKLADESAVSECMKTVVDGDAPSLAEAMVEGGVLDRESAGRVLRESGSDAPRGSEEPTEEPSEEGPPGIDGYEILQKLGEGGMGSVWLARQTSLERLVAIKILPPVFSRSEKLVARFRREALATAKLNHPNIVSAIDVGAQEREGEPDLYYFVIEYVDGESLEDIIERTGKIEAMRAAQIAIDVATALDHAWSEAGIVHRDIKPANILITKAGEVKLADLGLARSSYENAGLTTAGLAIGTPHYASPEQALGKAEVDVRSDIYALGATLFHMVTGRPPFEGDSAAAVMVRHVNEDAPLCTAVNPLVSQWLAAVAAKMMKRDPAERYQTPGELRADLERFTSGDRPLAYTRILDARERGAFSSAPPEVFTAARPGAEVARRARRGPRHWPHAIGSLLLLAAVGFGLWYFTKGPAPPGAPALPAESKLRAAVAGGPVALWLDISNPDRVVGSGGSFPASFSSRSGVRCYVKPRAPSYIYVVMVSGGGSSGPLKLQLLTPDRASPMPLLTNALTQSPERGGFHSLPPSAGVVAFIAVASEEAAGRAGVLTSLAKISGELSSRAPGLRAGIPRGRTFWYEDPEKGWLAGGERASGDTAVMLTLICERMRAIFGGGRVSMCGAATSCRPES
ncbi:MAG: protein kinase [Planctomycetota bacterium]